MKSKVLKITILTLIIMMLIQVSLLAAVSTLKLDLTANKTKIKIGQEIKIKVSWNYGMQAADFYLDYDSEKLEFIKADISISICANFG